MVCQAAGRLLRPDLCCYLEGGDRGPEKKQCATACAKAGNPIGILDAKGNLSIAILCGLTTPTLLNMVVVPALYLRCGQSRSVNG